MRHRLPGYVKRSEAREAETRQTAFLVSLMSMPKLLDAIRARDKDIHRLVHEIESTNFEDPAKRKPGSAKSERQKPKSLPKNKKVSGETCRCRPALAPLLTAISARRVDTCLLGARCLALLEDARAFGVLMQLSSEEDSGFRVQVCQSLGALRDARATDRLCMMLSDSNVSVRDAAYSALEEICSADSSLEPVTAAENGLESQHADVRLRALQSLVKLVRKSKATKGNARIVAAHASDQRR